MIRVGWLWLFILRKCTFFASVLFIFSEISHHITTIVFTWKSYVVSYIVHLTCNTRANSSENAFVRLVVVKVNKIIFLKYISHCSQSYLWSYDFGFFICYFWDSNWIFMLFILPSIISREQTHLHILFIQHKIVPWNNYLAFDWWGQKFKPH